MCDVVLAIPYLKNIITAFCFFIINATFIPLSWGGDLIFALQFKGKRIIFFPLLRGSLS